MWHFKRLGMTRRPMNEGTHLLFTFGDTDNESETAKNDVCS